MSGDDVALRFTWSTTHIEIYILVWNENISWGFAVSNFFLLPFSVCTVRLTPRNSHSQSQSQIQTFFSHSHEYITHLTSLNFVSCWNHLTLTMYAYRIDI